MGDLSTSAQRTELPDPLLLCDGAGGNTVREDPLSILAGELNLCFSSLFDISVMHCIAVACNADDKTKGGVCFENLPGRGRTCNLSRGTSV